MTHAKEAIIEYAKELYLTPNEQGNHRYSLRDISTEVQQKFNKAVNYSTISLWASKEGWDKLWEEGVRQGLTEALAKQESDKTKEEQFKEAIAKHKQDDFIIATNLKALGYKYIQANGFSSTTEALKAIDTGMKYTQELPEQVQNVGIQIIVKDDDTKRMVEKVLNGND